MTTVSSVMAVIPAQDIERATDFYEHTLGFTALANMPDGSRFYRAGDGSTFMVYPTEFAGTGKHTIAGFMVADVRQEVIDLREKGVQFNDYDTPELKTVDAIAEFGDFVGAWFTDTEGNIISIGEGPADWAERDWTS